MNGKEFEALIKEGAKKKGKLSLDKVGKELGMSRQYLYDLFAEDVVKPEYINLAKEKGFISYDQSNNTEPYKQVPFYDVDANGGNVTIFNEQRTEYIKEHISIRAFSDCDMFISISGNSMYPKYCAGEMIALKKIEDLEVIVFGEAYIVVTKEHRVLKYLRKGKDKDHWKLVSENVDYDPFEILKSKVLHLYIVKGKITKNII